MTESAEDDVVINIWAGGSTMTDGDWLDNFAALARTQTPTATPWEPVTDYSRAARDLVERPHAELIKVAFAPTRVLDVGCGPGHLIRCLSDIGVAVSGLDKTYRPEVPMLQRDIAAPFFEGLPFWSDLVICREVLEHLTIHQIAQAVRNLCRLTTRYVYVTTRFHPSPQHLLDVATSDDLDPTHITMLHQDLLRLLFVLEGFTRRADLEAQLDWKHYGRVLVYERR